MLHRYTQQTGSSRNVGNRSLSRQLIGICHVLAPAWGRVLPQDDQFGQGSRFSSSYPKAMHDRQGRWELF